MEKILYLFLIIIPAIGQAQPFEKSVYLITGRSISIDNGNGYHWDKPIIHDVPIGRAYCDSYPSISLFIDDIHITYFFNKSEVIYTEDTNNTAEYRIIVTDIGNDDGTIRNGFGTRLTWDSSFDNSTVILTEYLDRMKWATRYYLIKKQ